MVENAIIRFKSFWQHATVDPNIQVRPPIIKTILRIEGAYSKIGEQRIIKKTPAVTNVAAWIKAETGVGVH